MTSSSTQGIRTVLHPVSDLAKAMEVYAALLGTQPTADSSYYVGFDAEGQHIGLVPAGGRLVATVTDPASNILGLLQDR
jgi:predicted enzyme related to lactoylglutathione lyase